MAQDDVAWAGEEQGGDLRETASPSLSSNDPPQPEETSREKPTDADWEGQQPAATVR